MRSVCERLSGPEQCTPGLGWTHRRRGPRCPGTVEHVLAVKREQPDAMMRVLGLRTATGCAAGGRVRVSEALTRAETETSRNGASLAADISPFRFTTWKEQQGLYVLFPSKKLILFLVLLNWVIFERRGHAKVLFPLVNVSWFAAHQQPEGYAPAEDGGFRPMATNRLLHFANDCLK